MQGAHYEKADYDSEEVNIVMLANAVIQPTAMMIKPVNASIALTTVLG